MARNTSGLKPFKPGQSGNPGGRPKKKPITDEYFQMADQLVPPKMRKRLAKKWGVELPEFLTFSKANAIKRYLDMLETDGHRAAKEVREAIEGKAPMRIELSGPERKEITIRILHDRTKPQKNLPQSSKK